MFKLKHGIRLVCAALMLCGWTNATAFEASDLPDLRKAVFAACPNVWEPMTSRILYVEAGDPQPVPDVTYVVVGDDLWAGNRNDKIRYIAYAFEVLGSNNSELDMNYSSIDSAVIVACSSARADYFDTLAQSAHFDPDSTYVKDILDTVRDEDKDGVFNFEDVCPDTPIDEIADGAGIWLGCSASQRDTDDDRVTDDIDLCPGTPPDTVVDEDGCIPDEDKDGVPDDEDQCPGKQSDWISDEEGCAPEQVDSDDDGTPDYLDEYPHQSDTQCTP